MTPARTTRSGDTRRTLALLLAGLIVVMLGGIVAAALALSSFGAPETAPAGKIVSPAPAVGSLAPEIVLPRLENGAEGTVYKLSDLRGRPVILNFWATWCQPCREEFPIFELVYRGHRTTDRTELIAVNVEDSSTPQQVQAFADQMNATFPIWLTPRGDFAVQDLYNVRALPTTLFIDRTGVIRKIHIGGPLTQRYIEERLDEIK